MSTKMTAYGSITIVDITDIGEFSVTPESNKPNTVICDPNMNPVKYTPDWAIDGNPLILTPKARYAGNSKEFSDLSSVEWWMRDGVGNYPTTPITATEGDTIIDENGTRVPVPVYVKDGCLKVRKNLLATSTSKIISFKCTVKYIEPTTKKELIASGEISFSLVTNASQLKSCKISGENVFLYDAAGSLTNQQIVLTAQLTQNVSMGKWQFYGKDPTDPTGQTIKWNDIPGANASDKVLSVLYVDGQNNKFGYADANGQNIAWTNTYTQLFINDRLPLKAIANDEETYDEYTIVNLRNGRHGDSLIDIHLSNEDQVIPFYRNDQGNLVGNYTLATTLVSVYDSNKDVSSEWTFVTPSGQDLQNVTGDWIGNTREYKITSLTSEVGYVNFRATHNTSGATLEKKFTLSKVTTGIDGKNPIIYSIETNTPMVRRTFTYYEADENGHKKGELKEISYSHSTVKFEAFKQEGDATDRYQGHITIKTDTGASIYTGNDVNFAEITIDSLKNGGYLSTLKYLVCEIRAKNTSTGDPIKTQTVLFVSDGEQGIQGNTGANGVDALNVIISNTSDQIPCFSNGLTRGTSEIVIPFTGYQGITKTRCSLTVISNLPTGMRYPSGQTGTVEANNGSGEIKIEVIGNSNLGGNDSGQISLQATCYGTDAEGNTVSSTSLHSFKWTKNRQGESGADAVILQIDTPDGDIIDSESETSIRLVAELYEGAGLVSGLAADNYKWKKHTVGQGNTVTYEEIDFTDSDKHFLSADGKTLTILKDAVNGYASYKCEVTYNSNTYYAYQDVEDWVDELQVQLFCTLGTQILNGYGKGAIYAKVISKRDGEVDALKSDLFILKDDPNLQELLGGKTVYYELDPGDAETRQGNKVTLKEYKNGQWVSTSMTNAHVYKYAYSFRNIDGNIWTENNNFAKEGKVIYVDAGLIQKKVTVDVTVSKS